MRAGDLDRTDECLAKLDLLGEPAFQSVKGQAERAVPLRDGRGSARRIARLDTLRGARALYGGEFYTAVNHLRRALRREPSNAWTTRLLATACVKTGDLGAAADIYRRLILLLPDDIGARMKLAELAWQRNRLVAARDAVDPLPAASEQQQYQAELIKLACELRRFAGPTFQMGRSGSARRPPVSAAGTAGGAHPTPLPQDVRQRLERLASPLPGGSGSDLTTPADAASAQWLMRCLVLAGQPERAVDLFRRDPAGAEAAPHLGMELGLLLLSEQLADRAPASAAVALTVADELIQRFPEAVEGHLLRAKVLASTGRLSEAAAYVSECSLADRARGRLLEALGDEYLAAGQIESATEVLRQAAGLLPTALPVRQKLARQTSNLEEALTRSEEIRALEGDTGLHWKYEQAAVLLRLDPSRESTAQARKLLERCLVDRPRWPSARLLLGYAHELSGRLHDAVDAYKDALAQRPELRARPVAVRVIRLLKRLGQFVEADAMLKTLATALPDQPEVLRLRMEQQVRARDYASALATAEYLLELRPDDPAWAAVTADLHLRAGDPARAESIARAALGRSPDSTQLLWSLAQALMAQERIEEAEMLLREAATETGDAWHQLLLAQVLNRLERQAEAERAVARAQELAPKDAAVWAACADLWGLQGRRGRQLACARKAVRLQGQDPAKSLVLARLLASSDSAEARAEAGEIIRRRLQADPDDPPALIVEAMLALSTGPADLAQAEASLKRALAINPRSPTAYRLLAGVQIRSGETATAAETVAVGLAFAPDDADLLLSAAELRCRRGDYPRAILPLRRLLELKPRMLRAVRLLATAYHETGRLDRAIEFVEGLAPGEATAWQSDVLSAGETLVLARLHELNDDPDRAEGLLLHALGLDESSSETFQELVRFYARRADFQRVHTQALRRRADFPADAASLAVAGEILGAQCPDQRLRNTGMEWLEEIARDHPDHAADATYRSGMCYYQQKDLAKAEGKFLQASHLTPDAPGPVNALAWMYAEDLGRPAQARAVIDHFLAEGGREDPKLMDTHATVLLRLGELDAARGKLTECLKQVGQTSTVAAAHYHLGLVLLETGRTREAITHVQKALRLAQRLGGLTDREREQARLLTAGAPSSSEARSQ